MNYSTHPNLPCQCLTICIAPLPLSFPPPPLIGLVCSFHLLPLSSPLSFVSPLSFLPITHTAWLPIYPQLPPHPEGDCPEDKTIKSLIYVNKAVPTTSLLPLPTVSNCITAVSYALQSHTFVLISAYAPPKQPGKLHHLRDIFQTHTSSATTHLVVGMDCNLHHPLWNPSTYHHTHQEADTLIQMMTDANLQLRSEGGVPTFYPPNINHANTTIDLLWASSHCLDWIITCATDVEHNHSHLSDHTAITLTILLPAKPVKAAGFSRNWRALDPPPSSSSALNNSRTHTYHPFKP